MSAYTAPGTGASRILIAALAALAALFAAWFAQEPRPWPSLLVFALPPALLAIGQWRARPTAGYWASVLGLFWFSHGVMVAYSRPADRWYGVAEVALALLIIFAASGPGMRARLAQKKAARTAGKP